MFNSDGATPEEQAKQILAVAAILPGQQSAETNRIPPMQSRESHDGRPPTTTDTQPQTTENDLIDFGSTNSTTTTAIPSHFPSNLKLAQTQNNGQQQRELEQTLKSTSTSPPPGNQKSIIDFHGDVKGDVPVT